MSEVTEVKLNCSKELVELGDGVAKFLTVLMKEAEDGLDITDISSILSSAITDLIPALDGVTDISGEFESDREAFINGVGVTGSKIINVFL